MTREEMAATVEREALLAPTSVSAAGLIEAASELRKTCGKCRWFSLEDSLATCRQSVSQERIVPIDGSGFCHRYEPQPTGKAQD